MFWGRQLLIRMPGRGVASQMRDGQKVFGGTVRNQWKVVHTSSCSEGQKASKGLAFPEVLDMR